MLYHILFLLLFSIFKPSIVKMDHSSDIPQASYLADCEGVSQVKTHDSSHGKN